MPMYYADGARPVWADNWNDGIDSIIEELYPGKEDEIIYNFPSAPAGTNQRECDVWNGSERLSILVSELRLDWQKIEGCRVAECYVAKFFASGEYTEDTNLRALVYLEEDFMDGADEIEWIAGLAVSGSDFFPVKNPFKGAVYRTLINAQCAVERWLLAFDKNVSLDRLSSDCIPKEQK